MLSAIVPPSIFPRVPLAVPFWSGATYRAIFNSIVSNSIVDGAEISGLRSYLIGQFGVADAMLCGSGSLALELALGACGVRQGDEVVIPAFCCSTVVAPIVATGAVPVLADVGGELNLTVATVAPVLTRKTRAVIVPHLFGNPAAIEAIVELARSKNIRVIDDAAQAHGATIGTRLAGGFGDAGILSFGAEKVCFGLGGGALLSNRNDDVRDAARFQLTQPRPAAALGGLLSTLVWRRWRRWTWALHELLSSANFYDPDTASNHYCNERMANLNAAVALSLARTLNENINARRVRVSAYRELLGNVAGVELIGHQPGSACLTQVVRIVNRRPDQDLALAVIKALARAGYEVQGSYVPLHRLRSCSMCVWENLSHADRVWSELIELPCEPSVSVNNIERIAAIVRSAAAA